MDSSPGTQGYPQVHTLSLDPHDLGSSLPSSMFSASLQLTRLRPLLLQCFCGLLLLLFQPLEVQVLLLRNGLLGALLKAQR